MFWMVFELEDESSTESAWSSVLFAQFMIASAILSWKLETLS
jgi:hypothetical protein